jgi:G3E family GTPase
MIPVSVITGFLGSGKTTLLGRLLRDPSMGRTAVIINEFGSIALDHDLIETSDESFVRLSNGCLCCNIRSDLTVTLTDLAARRAAGTVPRFERVLIETSGLADPAPILHAVMTDPDLCDVYALDRVVTTVDAVAGLATLDTHEQSRRQAAVADTIVITKTDVPESQSAALTARLSKINPGAAVMEVISGAITPTALFGAALHNVGSREADMRAWLADETHDATDLNKGHHRHEEDITSFSITRDAPVHAVTLALFLAALAENCGPDLLRMKGIVRISEEPERPAVIHGMQHVYHAPVWLEQWPSEDRRTRMVFIGRHIPERWVRTLLDLLDTEVTDEIKRAHLRRSAR